MPLWDTGIKNSCLFTSYEDEHKGTPMPFTDKRLEKMPLWDNGTPTALRAVPSRPPGSIPGSGVYPFCLV